MTGPIKRYLFASDFDKTLTFNDTVLLYLNDLDKKNPYMRTIISSLVCPNRAASLRCREFLCFAN